MEEKVLESKKENPVLKVLKAIGRGIVKFFKFFDKNNNKGSRATMLEWKKDGWKAALCLAPALILLSIFTFYPIIKTFIVSFFPEYNYMTGDFGAFGFESYQIVLEHPLFWQGLGNTALIKYCSFCCDF